ncbi:Trm112 family protein [Prauserella rugosa]|uniref:UPF0434 protein JD82_02408 n=1 Tax=Prauserella rugosa TaxID=43354 RepID=A0A660CAR5_9PSEU|nr:Trm112 family protein [Prauserella rugosa]KMS65897.1 hypothetical protein ACZ91_70065 [Streptomyces regensis]TWH20562.1 hypothetical protein JD82_02408 [Prauserella rugosa]
MAVTLDPQLLDILACPCDAHAPLTPGTPGDPSADVLSCTSCSRRFPVRDGIPVLLLDEALTGEADTGSPVPDDSGTDSA